MPNLTIPAEEVSVLLIAGAARSGTTLLSNLLDSHSQIVCFPFEDNVLDCFYRKKIRDKRFYLNEFISNYECGQQSMLFNEKLVLVYKRKIEHIYHQKFDIDIDFHSARKAYLEYLTERPLSVQNIYVALGRAVIAGAPDYAQSKSEVKFLCFKRPSWVDVYLPLLLDEPFGVKALWIARDAKTRFVSAKTRRLKTRRFLSHINRYDYLMGHAMVDLMSQKLLEDVQASRDLYLVRFEELLLHTKPTIEEVLDFLKINNEACFSLATRLGVPANAGSSMVNASVGEVASASYNARIRKYHEITTWHERIIHDYILRRSYLKSDLKKLGISLLYLIPLARTDFKNYICQLLSILKLWRQPESLVDDFIVKFKKGEVGLSGEM